MPIKVTCTDGVIKREAMPFLISMSEVPACPSLIELMSYSGKYITAIKEPKKRDRPSKSGLHGHWKCQKCQETLPKSMFHDDTLPGAHRKCNRCRDGNKKVS